MFIYITLTQIVKNKPEEVTKPLVIDPNDLSVRRTLKNGTRIAKVRPIYIEYVVKETKEEISDMIEKMYEQEDAQPQYDFNRDISIAIKITDTKAGEIEYESNEYDYFYYNNKFLVIVKDNIIIREISIGKIIDISYNKKEEK